MLWPKETNAIAEGVECCDRRRRIRWPKESNAMVEGDKSGGWRSLKQATTSGTLSQHWAHCISFDSYIKPQRLVLMVMHLISCISFDSYIKPQPIFNFIFLHICCISFDSYIKPQPKGQKSCEMACCISFDSYIKPRPCAWSWWFFRVVYLLIPTSNHNFLSSMRLTIALYIFWFLHQTTTLSPSASRLSGCISFDSYIKPQL